MADKSDIDVSSGRSEESYEDVIAESMDVLEKKKTPAETSVSGGAPNKNKPFERPALAFLTFIALISCLSFLYVKRVDKSTVGEQSAKKEVVTKLRELHLPAIQEDAVLSVMETLTLISSSETMSMNRAQELIDNLRDRLEEAGANEKTLKSFGSVKSVPGGGRQIQPEEEKDLS